MHRMRRAAALALALILSVLLVSAGALAGDSTPIRTEEHTVRVRVLVQEHDHPWSVAFLPDGRMLVTEREGRLRLVRDGRLEPKPVSGGRHFGGRLVFDRQRLL